MDLLSGMLRTIRLTGASFVDVERRAPWVAEFMEAPATGTQVMPGGEHIIIVYALIEGSCWVEVPSHHAEPSRLQCGDIFILLMGDPHVLTSHLWMRSTPKMDHYSFARDRQLPFRFGPDDGSGELSHYICGYLGCDARPFHPLLQCLPPLLHIPSGQVDPSIMQLFRVGTAETALHRDGGETVLAMVAELLLVDALRRHIYSLPKEATGWLSGLRDAHIGAALALLHGRPFERWTVAKLAREVGLSRSIFADRFSHFMHDTPMHYLARWRMLLAKQQLEHHDTSLAQVAAEVGYDLEAAFNRAFKKCMGLPPGLWRRAHTREQTLR